MQSAYGEAVLRLISYLNRGARAVKYASTIRDFDTVLVEVWAHNFLHHLASDETVLFI
jgi:hypothetical protein